MKKLKRGAIIIWEIVVIAGCQLFHLGEPRLISPKNGEVFDSLPPTFVWHKEKASEYYLMAFKDSLWSKDTLIWDTLTDTTFTMSKSLFASADSGTYKWTVAVRDTASGELLYPSPRSFSIREFSFPIDLDTTYFPFGLGYEWCYERHDWGHSNFGDKTWDSSYSFSIKVVDSLWENDTLKFELEGGKFWDLDNPAELHRNQIEVVGKWVNIEPDTFSSEEYDGEGDGYTVTNKYVKYRGDTLVIYRNNCYVNSSESDYWSYNTYVIRLKGIGTITQNSGSGDAWDEGSSKGNCRLLWFFDGKDTVYKAPDY